MSLTGAAFLMAFLAGLGLAVFRHPLFGLYTYVAVFYLHPPSRWWGETLPDLRWALLAAVVTLILSWRLPAVPGRTPWLKTTPGWMLVLFTAWFWLQNLWALEPELHFEASILFTKYVLLYYLVYRLVVTPADLRNFLMVHVAGCAYLGWLAFNTDVSGRLEGVGGPGIDEANAFAMQMGTGVVMGAMLSLSLPGLRRWAVLAALPFVLNGVILSGSRGGFLALLCGGFMLWYLKPKAHRKLFYAFGCVGALLFGMLAHDMFWERMGTIEVAAGSDESQIDTSALSRYALVEAQMKMAQQYPQGAGHRGTAALSPYYLDRRFLTTSAEGQIARRSSHNTFMSALVEQGIPGAIFYVWIWCWTAVTIIKLKRDRKLAEDPQGRTLLAAVAAAIFVVLVAGIFVDYINAEVQIWLWALLASLQAAAQLARSRPTVAGREVVKEESVQPAVRGQSRAARSAPT